MIRPACLEDAEEFVRAHERAWDATIGTIVGKPPATLAPFDARVEQFRASFGRLTGDAGALVAVNEDEVVGLSVYAADELHDLYVVPEAWGSGAAAALESAVLAAIRKNGVDEAFLWVGEANARARRFYERQGWSTDGESRRSGLGPSELRYRKSTE
jgi:GNAT superfamily N-acetyltransferase